MGLNQIKVCFGKKMVCIFTMLVFIVTVSGCSSSESVYDKFQQYELNDEELELLSEGKLDAEYSMGDFDSFGDYLKYLAASYISGGTGYLKAYAIPLIIASWCIGIILLMSAKKSIQIRKAALLIFIIAIPALLILAVYGTAILADNL